MEIDRLKAVNKALKTSIDILKHNIKGLLEDKIKLKAENKKLSLELLTYRKSKDN